MQNQKGNMYYSKFIQKPLHPPTPTKTIPDSMKEEGDRGSQITPAYEGGVPPQREM
jgi:hypothetical protein